MSNMNKAGFKSCDIYAARLAALRPLPAATLKSLREYYRVGLTYTSKKMQSIGIDSEKAYPAALSSATDSPHVSCNPMHSRIAVILSMPECADDMIREYD